MRKVYLSVALWIFCLGVSRAQDAHFTQFENSPFFTNPAAAGMIEQSDFRGSLITRNQWRKLVRPTNQTLVSADAPLLRYQGGSRSKSNLGIGLSYGFATMGDSRTRMTNLALALSGMTTIGTRKYLGVGVSAGKGGMRSDLSNATWDAQYNGYKLDESLPTGEAYEGRLKARFFDLSAGLNFLSVNGRTGATTNFGIAYLHANNPKLKNEPLLNGKIDPRIVAHFRSEIQLDLKNTMPVFIIPRALVGMQGVHMEIQAGATVFWSAEGTSQVTGYRHKTGFEAGGMYRHGDAVGLLAGWKTESYRIGLSYDISISAYGKALNHRGGTEISFIYYAVNKEMRSRKAIYD
ncbi:MAG: PorP/SprF family type IX secretion system membrane protein [Flavobacteriales bacterium]